LANSPAFDWLCEHLEIATDLDRLEARGTVRIALKSAGLDAATVLPDQMRVVIERVLPIELVARGIDDAEQKCADLALGVSRIDAGRSDDSPDEVFRRLGRF
jgi:hypothetical protein